MKHTKGIILVLILLFFSINCFSQYVSVSSGAWYNNNGTIYIVRSSEINKCEVVYVIIDNMFKVSQIPEIGVVNASEDTLWEVRDVEVINFQDRTIKVRDAIYAPTSLPIGIFGKIWSRYKYIFIPKVNDVVSKRIYIEDKIEIIQEGITNEYFDLINKLNESCLVVFNNAYDSEKYIFKDMKLLDSGERFGEGDEIVIELYNETEAILKWKCYSTRAPYPGVYTIKIYNKPNFQATHRTKENLRIRVNPTLNAGTIIVLSKNSKVKVLEMGRNETIDGINANWVKVVTDSDYVGWCFSGYLQTFEN